MPQNRADIRVVAFPSELGWIAFARRGAVFLEISFGHPTPAAASRALRCGEPVLATPNAHERKLVARFQAFAAGADDDFVDLPLDLQAMTAFQQEVIRLCRQVGPGTTMTYGQLAERAGSPRAARAVGNVMAQNRFPLVVPCHRIVGRGSLGGYSAPEGLSMKRRLLAREGVATC